jgi:hypothetical protein
MGAIRDWATPENLQPEPIIVEIWRELPEEFCRQVEVVNGQAVRCEAPRRADQAAARRLATVLDSGEVVSPGSDKTDRVEKMGEYASAGIPFYWLVWISDNRVASIDVHVLDHAVGAYRLLRTLGPEDELSVLEVPVRIKVPWSELSALVR